MYLKHCLKPKEYLTELVDVLNNLDFDVLDEIIKVFQEARQKENSIFVFGNGGSAAAASHMTSDLGKNTRMPNQPRVRILSLNDNIPTLTAYANDEGYENIFSEPLLSLAKPGDVAIAISGSGNSLNVLKAINTARQIGMKTIGLTGFQGGKLKEITDICLIVPSDHMEQIEDVHLIINHMIAEQLRS